MPSLENKPADQTPLLDLRGVCKRFGVITVTDHVALTLARGERLALIGPNGAGKSTLFNLITGVLPVSSGEIHFQGQDVTRMREDARARLGIGRTFQHSKLFDSMDPVGNIVMALRRRRGARIPVLPNVARKRAMQAEARELMDRVGLDPDLSASVSDLAHGQRRQLEVAMALALEPEMLLFDEPTAGMSSAETGTCRQVGQNLPDDLSVVLIEHDLDVVFSLADRIVVLAAGAVIANGSPQEIRASPVVRTAYLGADLEGVFR